MGKYDWGNAAAGGVSGAATGSAFGPIGTGVGAVVGFTAGLFGSKKKKKKPKKLSTLDENQQALYGDYVDSIRGQGPFSDLYNYDVEGANKNFDQNVSRPAYRNFQENIIPGITGQYRNSNLMNSSYSGEALGRAGRNVQENLDAQRSNMIFQGQNQAQQNKIQGVQNVLGTQTFAYQKPGAQAPSMIDQILGSVGEGAGQWLADYMKKGSGPSSPSTPSAPGINGLAANGASTAANFMR